MSTDMSRSVSYWFWRELRGLLHNPYVKKKKKQEWRWKPGEGTGIALKLYWRTDALSQRQTCGVLNSPASGGSRIAFAHAADFRESEITWGETKMWCQLLKESYHCYWILSFVWWAIALHLLLTTSFSIHGPFANSAGLVTFRRIESDAPRRHCCCCKQSDKRAMLM